MRAWAVLAAVAAIGLCGASQAPLPNNGERQDQQRDTQRPRQNQSVTAAPQPLPIDTPAGRVSQGARDGDAKPQHHSEGGPKWLAIFRFFDRHNGSFNAIAALVVAFFTYFLWRIGERQTEILHQNASETRDSIDISRRSADAAEKSASAATAAARATRRLVGAMTASAQAAHDAVRISERANEVLLRPYVYIVDEKVSISVFHAGSVDGNIQAYPNDIAPVSFSIRNFGQTPAKRVRIRARTFIGEHWTEGGQVDLETVATIHRADMPPGFERPISGYAAVGIEDAYASLRRGAASIFFDGVIEYEDAAGGSYKTNFRRVCAGPDDIQAGRFFITPEGNEAT